MTRLIDADSIHWFVEGVGDIPVITKEEIDDMPTVDALPVRHGKWIEHEWAEESEGLLIPNYECSECHMWERKKSDYCPNCGARMDEEKEE